MRSGEDPFRAAVAKVKRHVDPQKYQLFEFYVIKEWPAEKVAEAFACGLSTYIWPKHRISEILKEEVRRLEKEMILSTKSAWPFDFLRYCAQGWAHSAIGNGVTDPALK